MSGQKPSEPLFSTVLVADATTGKFRRRFQVAIDDTDKMKGGVFDQLELNERAMFLVGGKTYHVVKCA